MSDDARSAVHDLDSPKHVLDDGPFRIIHGAEVELLRLRNVLRQWLNASPELLEAVITWGRKITRFGAQKVIEERTDVRLELATGELIPEVWERWLRWDPVRMARTDAGKTALRSLRAIYIDAGTHDEYFLDLGAEAFRREVAAAGAVEPFFELFDAKHGMIEYRYPIAIRYLAERLAG